MLRAVLFDLDDTLLGNAMDTFLPAYFQALTRYLDHLIPPERLIADLMRATKAMDADHRLALTNEEAFASVFYPLVGQDRATVERAFERFYAEEFPKLRRLTRRRPEARSLVASALEQGLQVTIATNPMFPRIAVEERLSWAGVPVEQFEYALVTTYENMHATKSHLAYYREILERLDRRPGECLMVGDSWKMDVVPASSVGIPVFWVTEEDALPTPHASVVGRGRLADLWVAVQGQGWSL
ncbi:MAG: HAD family hydrolase [Anaerolineae bacterium]|jgi:FMN phosphatase YigB (HAD superfamily)